MSFEITKDTLPGMQDRGAFTRTYTRFCESVMGDARLFPKFTIQRVHEAHGAWVNDLSRVGTHEPKLKDGDLDHFKRCGHLTFWIRRMSPMVEAVDLTKNVGDAEGMPVGATESEFRDLLFAYGNEYLAFELGYQLCRFYEVGREGGSKRAEGLVPSVEYYRTMCHFLKYKTVSPHAIFLIYKSLFL